MIVLDFDSLEREQQDRARSPFGHALLDELSALSRSFSTVTIRGAAAGQGILQPEAAVEAGNLDGARLLVEQATLVWIGAGEQGDPFAFADAPETELGPAAVLAQAAVRRARALALDAERVTPATPEDPHDAGGGS